MSVKKSLTVGKVDDELIFGITKNNKFINIDRFIKLKEVAMVTASKEEIEKNVKSFLKVYFKEYFKLMENNSDKIKNLEEISYPEFDVMFIFKFIRVELSHLKQMDANIVNYNLRKLYENTAKTVAELVKFKKEYLSGDILFINNFSAFNDEARTINDEFEKEKMEKSVNASRADRITKELKNITESDEETIKLIKKLNSELADTLQYIDSARSNLEKITIEKEDFDNQYRPIFLDTYKNISDKIVSKISNQINIFAFSMDRDMWKNSTRSKRIVDFFKSIGQTENMNIQQYMEFHLKNQTSSDSKDQKQIKFRKKLIDAINKVKLFNEKQKSI